MGLVLSVTLAYVRLTGAREGCGEENGPLLYGKELKAVELQLVLYDFKGCILSEPDLACCEMWLLWVWRGLGRDKAGAT